tara:strand:+ start:253 stop:1536 length:1284 start_codon:yes stop_codon:yes gene_type:complete
MSLEELYENFKKSSGVITDSRKIKQNQIFFSLKGVNFNGNKFAKAAIKNGALLAIVDEKKYFHNNENYILVDDSLKTLQSLANYHRKKLKTKIIAITGSNGKTTSKELIYSVLKINFKTYCTKGNLNNHIGVPLSLLEISNETEFAVIEMGANHISEIELLSKIAEPDYGYITNFGKAHLEGFGSEEGVIKGKTELYEFLKKSSGFIFYNSDDNKQKKNISNYKNKFSFGKESSDLNYSVKIDNSGIIIEVDNIIIKSSLFGNYNITNIVSAISIGYYFGIPIEKIRNGISDYISSNNRSQKIKINSNNIILDAYNANPTSMLLAIKSFEKAKFHNKVLILGDMFELGKNENKFHQEIVDYCNNMDVIRIFLVGEIFSKTNYSNKFISCNNYIELSKIKEFKEIKNSSFLIKGSRAVELEKILQFIS